MEKNTNISPAYLTLAKEIEALKSENREIKRHLVLSSAYMLSTFAKFCGKPATEAEISRFHDMCMDNTKLDIVWAQFKESNIEDLNPANRKSDEKPSDCLPQ